MRLRSPRSARLRLTLQYAAMFLLLGTVVIVIIYLLVSHTTTVNARVVTPAGSVSFAVPVPAAPNPPHVSVRVGSHTLTVVGNVDRATKAISGVFSDQRNAVVGNLLVISWFVLAITAIVSAGLGWVLAGRVLRPVRAMTSNARTISAGSPGQRLALTGPDDEFRRLGGEFNALLARLDAAFESQRRFVANASHELRTPLTFDRTLLQVALADPDATAATLRAACEELLVSGRDQERLLEALLTLASSERGIDRRVPVDLARPAASAAAACAGEAQRRSVTVLSDLAPALTAGDPALIERLTVNLLDNAIRYNHPGGWVSLRTAAGGSAAVLTVANTGPRVAPEDRELLFEPFRRLAGARLADPEGHHGLGLSIVRAIASSHGAVLTALPRPEGGLEVSVEFPGAGESDGGGQ